MHSWRMSLRALVIIGVMNSPWLEPAECQTVSPPINTGTDETQTADRMESEGDALVAENKYCEAAALFSSLVDLHKAKRNITKANAVALKAAVCWIQLKNFQKATSTVTPLFEQLTADSDKGFRCRVIVVLGTIALGEERYPDAEQRFTEAAALIPEESDSPYQRAFILRGLGTSLLHARGATSAAPSMLKACTLFAAAGANEQAAGTFWDLFNGCLPDERLGLMTGETQGFDVDPSSDMADALGVTYSTMRASVALTRADFVAATLWSRAIMRGIDKNRERISPDELVTAVSCAAMVFNITTTASEAVETLRRATLLVVAKKAGPAARAEFYIAMANLQLKHKPADARQSYESARAAVGDTADRCLRLQLLLTKACVEGASGNHEESARALNAIQEECDRAGVKTMAVSLLMAQSMLLRDGKQAAMAVQCARQALSIAQNLPSLSAKVRSELAMGLAGQHKWKEAVEEMLVALRAERTEAVTLMFLIAEPDRRFVDDAFLPADADLIVSAAVAAAPDLATHALEAVWLTDHLGFEAAQVTAHALGSDLPAEGEAKRLAWEGSRERLARDSSALLRGGPQPEKALVDQVKADEADLSGAWQAISSWVLGVVPVQSRRIDPKSVIEALSPGQILLQYVKYSPSDELNDVWAARGCKPDLKRYAVIAVTRQGTSIADLGDAESVEAMVNRYVDALTHEVPRDREHERLLAEFGLEARRVLIDPVVRQWDDKSQLIVAPVSQLSQLPFQALPSNDDTGAPVYLLERVEIVYAQSPANVSANRSHVPPGSVCFIIAPDEEATDKVVAESLSAGGKEGVFGQVALTSEFAEVGRATVPLQRQAGSLGVRSESFLGSAACRPAVLYLRPGGLDLLVIAAHGHLRGGSESGVVSPMLRSEIKLAGSSSAPSNKRMTWISGRFTESGSSSESGSIALADGALTAFDFGSPAIQVPRGALLLSCESGAGAHEGLDWIGGMRTALLCKGTEGVACSTVNIPIETTLEVARNVLEQCIVHRRELSAATIREAQLAELDRLRKGKGPVSACGHPFWWALLEYWGSPN